MEELLDEVCGYLNNWFHVKPDGIHRGTFKIEDGSLDVDFLQANQYFRIRKSVFNDGVYIYPNDELIDEEFTGEIWAMAVPPAVIAVLKNIEEWNAKYGTADSVNMSPFNAESFANYSYSKATGSSGNGGSGGPMTWRDAFGSKLARWRKL